MHLDSEESDLEVVDSRSERAVDCSVLMPAYNEERHIVASVAAMRAQRFSGSLEFLVVDGGSTDRTAEIVRELAREDPRIRLLQNPRRIAASGLNVALGSARGRWAARMDAHTEYPDDYLQLGVDRLRQGGTRWVSGLALARGRGPVSQAVGLALKGPLGRGGSRKWVAEQGPDREYELDSGVFAGVWERRTLLDYGGWDECWRRNQDSEMAGRFLQAGETLILIPAMAAAYSPRDSLRGLTKQYFEYGVYRTKTAARHPQTMRRSHVLAPGIVVALATAVVAPRPARDLGRAGGCLYLAALATAGIQARSEARRSGEAALVPAVLFAMHVGYGVGVWVEAARSGPPWSAIAGVCGLPRLAQRLAPGPSEVCAPSLAEALQRSRGSEAAEPSGTYGAEDAERSPG